MKEKGTVRFYLSKAFNWFYLIAVIILEVLSFLYQETIC
jgi:hypothetical protein